MATLKLGGQETDVPELAYLKNKEWSATIQPYVDTIAAMEKSLLNGADVGQVYQNEWMQTLESVGYLFQIVLDRIPDEVERARVEETATQTEILDAFFTLVKEANSTGFFMGMASALYQNGAQGQAIGTSSPEQSGEFGQTN